MLAGILATAGLSAVVARSADDAGNTAASDLVALRTVGPGAAVHTAEEYLSIRTGGSPAPGRSWTGWRRVFVDDSFRAPGRHLQFRLGLSAPARAPLAVTAVGFTHDGIPPEAVHEHH